MFRDLDGLSASDRAAIERCVRTGVIKGFPDGTFGPQLNLTRLQACLLMDRVVHVVQYASRQIRPATVDLYNSNLNKGGAGLFVNNAGTIITGRHVVVGKVADSDPFEHAYTWTMRICTAYGTVREGALDEPEPKVVFLAKVLGDLAAIILPPELRAKLPENLAHLPLNDEEPEIGERLLICGSPLGMRRWVCEGMVNEYPYSFNDGLKWVGINAPVNPGNSGGPATTLDGKLRGIVLQKPFVRNPFGGFMPGDDMGYILATSEIRKWCQKAGVEI